jgi:hypothetical protein
MTNGRPKTASVKSSWSGTTGVASGKTARFGAIGDAKQLKWHDRTAEAVLTRAQITRAHRCSPSRRTRFMTFANRRLSLRCATASCIDMFRSWFWTGSITRRCRHHILGFHRAFSIIRFMASVASFTNSGTFAARQSLIDAGNSASFESLSDHIISLF